MSVLLVVTTKCEAEGSLNLKTDNDDDRRPFFVSACIIESDMAIFNAATCLNLTFSKGIC